MQTGRAVRALLALALLGDAGIAVAAITAVDDEGATVTLPRPAVRVISLAPHLTEQLFAVGAGASIVGTTEHADFPPQARSIARVARAHSVDLERIVALRPDLIVLWGSGFPPAVIASVRRLGVPVFVSEPHALEDVARSLRALGVLTGHDGAPAANAFESRLATLHAEYANRSIVRVFYQVWASPLMTLSGRHVISEAIALCGGRNVFAQLAPIAPQVSVEAVLAADPQAIITAEPAGKPGDALAMWTRYPGLSAAGHGQLYTIDADRMNRHGPRLVDEIAVLCEDIEKARQSFR
ncbi:MAG TPA: cobalamin-binding protein [Burkholderiaceae bacterium]|nr:cobalamin-binding protein [Burkholderiaceae bacterium]